MKKKTIRFTSVLLVLFMFLGIFNMSLVTASAGDIFDADVTTDDVNESGDTIRIGFYEMDGFQYYNDVDVPTGYCVDYLNLISNFTGWNYEYVKLNSYSAALNRIESGDVDLVAPIMYMPEWEDDYEYSDFSICMGHYVIICNEGNDKYVYDQIESLQGATVSVPDGYPITEEFLKFVEENSLDVKITYYNSTKAAISAMRNGDVDCSIDTLMAIDSDDKVITQFSSDPMYFISQKGNTELISELDEAMKQVQEMYANEITRMEKTHFPSYSKQYFTQEEVEFIKNSDVIRVAYVDDMIPISFHNTTTGEIDGVTKKLLEEISRITELKFEFVKIPSGTIGRNFVSDNKIDLLTSVENNRINTDLSNMYMSIPYITTERVFVSKEEKDFNPHAFYTVAISSGSGTFGKFFETIYPNITLQYYDSNEDCFEAVRKGEVDYLIDTKLNVEYFMDKPLYEEFSVVSTYSVDEELCFSSFVYENGSLNEEECRMLIRILDKAILEISSDAVDTMIIEETIKHRYEHTPLDTIYKYRFVIIVGSAAIVIILAILIYIIVNNNRHMHIHKQEAANNLIQKKRYELVMDSSEDMIYEIGATASTEVSSEKIRETFGWEIPSSVEALNFDTIMRTLHIHPDDEDKLYEQYGTRIETEGIESAIVQMKSLHNNYLWCEISVVPLFDEKGKLISFVGKIKNVDDDVKSIEAQGKELKESLIKNENLEELLVNALTDNIADIIKLNLKSGDVVWYKVKEGMITEQPFEMEWDEYFSQLVKAMSSEDAIRIGGAGKVKSFAKLQVGTIKTYQYKARYDIRKKKNSKTYHFYTTKCSIVEINDEKYAIITSIDDTEIMNREDSYNEQREEFASKLFESQRFLFSAISGTYITTLKISLKDGEVYGLKGTEEGILESTALNIKWSEYLEKELIPFLDRVDVDKFTSQASLEALAGHEIGDAITVSFKAKLDPENLDPCIEYNWFIINFRILEERGELVSTVIFQCDTENIEREMLKNKEREAHSRQKRLEALVDRTEDIVFEIDLDNNECLITGRKDNLYGWDMDMKITDVSVEKIISIWGVHPEDRFVIGEAVQIIFAKGTTVSKDVRIQKNDGSYIWSRISAVPVINEISEITSIICKISNITDEVKEKKKLDNNVRMDKLTGLLTQNSMIEVTEKYLREHSAKNDAFILIDMDQLKSINETLDRKVGDRVLTDTAKKLQIIFSNYDFIGKYEGDTFCVYVKNIPADTLEDKLEWALEKLKDSYSYNGKIVQVSASIGVAYCMAEKANYKDLYELADSTVYEAKKTGNGQYSIKRFF